MRRPDAITPRLIGIAGGSGSGKTWLADRLSRVFKNRAVLISQDWYYRDQAGLSRAAELKLNFDHPRAFDTPLLLKQLLELKAGRGVRTPRYEYGSHRQLDKTVPVASAPLILIEGIFILHEPRIRRLLDLSVFVDMPADIRLLRRIRRDTGGRGIPVEETLRLYERFVRPMHERYVQPSAAHATDVWMPLTDRGFPAKLALRLRKMLS